MFRFYLILNKVSKFIGVYSGRSTKRTEGIFGNETKTENEDKKVDMFKKITDLQTVLCPPSLVSVEV